MANIRTARVTKMTTWPRLGLPEWPRWLHGQDGDYQCGPYSYMAKMSKYYQSSPDGYLDMMGTTRVAKMTT